MAEIVVPVSIHSFTHPSNLLNFTQFFSNVDFLTAFLQKDCLYRIFDDLYFKPTTADIATQFTSLFFGSKCLDVLSVVDSSKLLSSLITLISQTSPLVPQGPMFLAKLFAAMTRSCPRVSVFFGELNGFAAIHNCLGRATPRQVCDVFIELLESQAETRSSNANSSVILFMYQLFQEKPRLRPCIFDAIYQSIKKHPERIEGINSAVKLVSWFQTGCQNLPHFFDLINILDSYSPLLVRRCFPFVMAELVNDPKEPPVYASLVVIIDHQMAIGALTATHLVLLDFYSVFIFQPPPETLAQIFSKSLSFGPLILEIYKLQISASYRYTVFQSIAAALASSPDSGVVKAFLLRLVGLSPQIGFIDILIEKQLHEHIATALGKSKDLAAEFARIRLNWVIDGCSPDIGKSILTILVNSGFRDEVVEFLNILPPTHPLVSVTFPN